MYAVGKLGGYISRGVVTFSAPFHPFGGAVDIVVVKQEDGSFKSSPWYVQFGKFQGVLKAREKVVSINVNGVDADFRMYLDSKGGAYFLREVEGEEEVSESVSSSGDDTDGELQRVVSCKSDLQGSKPVSEFKGSNGKVMTRSISTGPRILGIVSKCRLDKEDDPWNQENGVRGDREASLERAEIAADLLEVMWSTSLATSKQASDADLSKFELRSRSDSSIPPESNGKADAESPLPTVTYMESFTLEEMYLGVNLASDSSVGSNEFDAGIIQSHEGEISGGDESRVDRLQSSIYSEASESFAKELDGSSGESSESSSFTCPDAATTSCVETKVEVSLECETNEACGKYAKEMLMNQVSSNQEPGSTNSVLMEELTNPKHGSMENIGSKEPCSYTSTNLPHLGSHEINGSPVVRRNECFRDAIQLKTKNDDVSEHTEREKLLCSNLDCSESHRIESTSFTSPDSVTSESNFQDLGEGSEDKVGGSTEKLNEEQFSFSDLDGSDPPKTIDSLLDSLETENDPKHYSGSSKEKSGESTGMLRDLHSFAGCPTRENLPHDKPTAPEMSRTTSRPVNIAKVREPVDQVVYTVESLPSFLSSGAEMDAQSFNRSLSHSFGSSIGNMRLPQGNVPSTLETDALKQQSTSRRTSRECSQTLEELKNILSDPAVEISLCRHLLFEGMGYEAAAHAFDAENLDMKKLVSLGPDIIKNDRLVVRIGGLYFPWDAALPIISAIGSPGGEQILEPKGMITIDQVGKTAEGNPQQPAVSSKGTWALWPFRKTKSLNRSPSNVSKVTDGQGGTVRNADTPDSKNAKRKFVRVNTPTSQQLASLNLKEGRNEVTFTFSTPMLGEQKVDARMFLWKRNARVVISDVDGTITKSDVLGQFMPMVGVDWSQTGVAHLFSAIKENGYELLFLSARAISQASLTRQFLFNLKQDGKALPEGPVVISPDGLVPSLFREVIRRAPHEFKIACLEDIKALFPPDHNPFYAGFGNRLTDEISYLQVGIPKGKIFTINPRGEVAVHRRVDTKSYTSLHTLVHDMFPPRSSVSSSEQEIFNSWQFWKLPPSHDLV